MAGRDIGSILGAGGGILGDGIADDDDELDDVLVLILCSGGALGRLSWGLAIVGGVGGLMKPLESGDGTRGTREKESFLRMLIGRVEVGTLGSTSVEGKDTRSFKGAGVSKNAPADEEKVASGRLGFIAEGEGLKIEPEGLNSGAIGLR